MSVYRAAARPIAPDTPPPILDTSEEIDPSATSVPVLKAPSVLSKKNRRQSANMNKTAENLRRPSIRDYKAAPSEKNVEIVRLRSAQKVRKKNIEKK